MAHFRTFELAKQFHRRTRHLRLDRSMKSQFDRAALSVALNLAEGRGKGSTAEQVRFFRIAMGSIRECQAIFDLAGIEDAELVDLLDHLGASTYRLIERAR